MGCGDNSIIGPICTPVMHCNVTCGTIPDAGHITHNTSLDDVNHHFVWQNQGHFLLRTRESPPSDVINLSILCTMKSNG